MNINSIQSINLTKRKENSLKQQANATQKFSQAADEVSFKGKTIFNSRRGRSLAAWASALLFSMTAASGIATTAKGPSVAYAAEATSEAQKADEAAKALLKENIDYQLAQTKDSPSVTFDFSKNYEPFVIQPKTSKAYVSSEAKDADTYTTARAILEEQYGIDTKKQSEQRDLAIGAFLKENPWIASEVTGYNVGDVTNLDPEVVLDAEIGKNISAEHKTAVFLPDVTLFNEAKSDDKLPQLTKASVKGEFKANGANKDGKATLTISKDELAAAQTEDAIISLVRNKIGEQYGISEMNSLAGETVMHGAAIWHKNAEQFKYASEANAQKAMASYVMNNRDKDLTLELPNVKVDMIVPTNAVLPENPVEYLMQQTDRKAAFSYLSVDEPVIDIANDKEFSKDQKITGLQVLDKVKFPGGTTVKELYESDKAKYESLALAAFGQIVDNDNHLQDVFGTQGLKAKDLTKAIDYSKIIKNDAADAKINLQPVTFAQVISSDFRRTGDEGYTFVRTIKPDGTPELNTVPKPIPTTDTTPSDKPTEAPSQTPTDAPTTAPTDKPTEAPSQTPTDAPTTAPTDKPTEAPTTTPTSTPTSTPTTEPTEAPTTGPTSTPTTEPTTAPTTAPTEAPTTAPTDAPTTTPTVCPPNPDVSDPTEENPPSGEPIMPDNPNNTTPEPGPTTSENPGGGSDTDIDFGDKEELPDGSDEVLDPDDSTNKEPDGAGDVNMGGGNNDGNQNPDINDGDINGGGEDIDDKEPSVDNDENNNTNDGNDSTNQNPDINDGDINGGGEDIDDKEPSVDNNNSDIIYNPPTENITIENLEVASPETNAEWVDINKTEPSVDYNSYSTEQVAQADAAIEQYYEDEAQQ